MSAMASQITGASIIYSTVCSGTDQRKHQNSTSLAFVRGIQRWPVNSLHKGPVTRKMCPLDDVIIQSSVRLAHLGGESTGDRWIPLYKGSIMRKAFPCPVVFMEDIFGMMESLPFNIYDGLFLSLSYNRWIPHLSAPQTSVLDTCTTSQQNMMAYCHEIAFRITGPLWRESIDDRWIPLKKGQ